MTSRKKVELDTSEISKLAAVSKETAEVVAQLREEVENLGDSVLNTKARTLRGNKLQQAVWKIWGYTRFNKNDLDSERHCKMISEVLASAVADIQREAESKHREISTLKKQLKEQKKRANLLEKENKSLNAQLEKGKNDLLHVRESERAKVIQESKNGSEVRNAASSGTEQIAVVEIREATEGSILGAK